VNPETLDVVWPLHRGHYLLVPDLGRVNNMEAVEEALAQPPAVTPDRAPDGPMPDALALRALLGGTCSQQRVAELFGTSRRTVGRLADGEYAPALRDPQALERARTCLEATAARGSTAAERTAAGTWLTAAARDAHHAEVTASRHVHPPERPVPKTAAARASRLLRNVKVTAAHVRRSSRPGARRAAGPDDPPAPAPRIPVEALRRQQQRILHHSAIVNYILLAEQRGGAPQTPWAALGELISDITEAAQTIGTFLPTTNGRP
jgi:hypothetical protein